MAKTGPKSKLTPQAKQFIAAHYKKSWTLEQIAREIGCSISAVFKTTQKIGLTSQQPPPKKKPEPKPKPSGWSRERDQFLLQHKNKLSDAELADRLGSTIAEINRRWHAFKPLDRKSSIEIEMAAARKREIEAKADFIRREFRPLRVAQEDDSFRFHSPWT